jgi:hypothetical protein
MKMTLLVRHVGMKLAHLIPILALMLIANSRSFAEPSWIDNPKNAPTIAAQTGKGVVMYFESPQAEECKRMQEETWIRINRDEADENFLWLRLNPQEHQNFFTYYEVFQVPEIVVLNSNFEERIRLQGFVEDWVLLERLKEVPRNKSSVLTTSDGRILPANDPAQAKANRESILREKPFFYESFDDFTSIDQMRNSMVFSPVALAATRIDPLSGVYGSPCLVVDAGTQHFASVRLVVGLGLPRVEQVEGRMRMRVKMKAVNVTDEISNVAALETARLGQDYDPATKRYFVTLSNAHDQWFEREIISEPFNFKSSKAWVTFQVAWPGMSYLVDDVRIDLLPPTDDMIVAAPVQTVADPSALLATPTEHPIFQSFDRDRDGRIKRSEIAPSLITLFDAIDANKDGVITQAESDRHFEGK